ncbi:hypothetical protein Bca101_005105 [Brassica carinata]
MSPHLIISSSPVVHLNLSFLTGLNIVFWLKFATSAEVQRLTSSHLISSSKSLHLLASSEALEARLCSPAIMVNYTMDVTKP